MPKHSILIIREQGEMVTACCVPLDGGFVNELNGTDIFKSCQVQIQSTAELYKILSKDKDDHTEIIVVDPRNYVYILPKLIKDVIRFRVPLLEALKTIFLYRMPAVIVNGYLISSGKTNFSEQTIEQIKSHLIVR